MEQRLVQSPQMIQAMQILQLPLLELSERIEQELVENPFLEVTEPERDDAGQETEGGERVERLTRDEGGAEQMLELLERIDGDFGDGSRTRQPAAAGEDSDRKYEAMMNAPEGAATLPEAILEQLSALDVTPREWQVLEYVVWSLDERGYLTETPSTLAAELSLEFQRSVGTPTGVAGTNGSASAVVLDDGTAADNANEHADADPDDLVVTEDEVRDALERLRENVHPGLGATSLEECLLLQLPGRKLWNPLMRGLIEHHLDDVRANRLPQIAKALGEDIETIKAAIEELQDLDPSPGAGFGDVTAEVIHPEVMVDLVDGEVACRLDRDRTPPLQINRTLYKQLFEQGTKEEKDWARKRLESASWLKDAILQRESTLARISKAIFERQRSFLERGAESLAPLRMQEIADEVGVHISTVSRAVAGKYAQTPRGIHPLKYFFVGGTTKASGEETSQVSIKERIKRIVAAEDTSRPLSDEGIAKVLEDQEGIKIARRTVTKYRKALEIPSSTQRKSY